MTANQKDRFLICDLRFLTNLLIWLQFANHNQIKVGQIQCEIWSAFVDQIVLINNWPQLIDFLKLRIYEFDIQYY